jgi:hypothetical protein
MDESTWNKLPHVGHVVFPIAIKYPSHTHIRRKDRESDKKVASSRLLVAGSWEEAL